MKHKKLIVSMALCVLLFTGCGAKITALEMTLADSLPVGDTALAQIDATYEKPDATDEDKAKALEALGMTFTSSDEAVATVDASGKVTAVAGGNATITATAKDLSASKEIEVLVPLTGVEAAKTLELVKNKTDSGKVDAKPVPANANVEGKPTYASSDEKIATVSADGTVTAVANGEAVITTTMDGKTAETKVTVTTAATGIALESAAGWVYVGGGYTLNPHTVPSEAPASTYTYTSENTGVATVNEQGVITGKSVGTAKITIKSAEGFETAYTVTIKAKPVQTKPNGSKPGASTGGGTTAGGGTTGGGTTGGGAAPAPAPNPAPPAPTEPQHYHGNGSDGGQCPACGTYFSPSVGVDGTGGDDAGDLT